MSTNSTHGAPGLFWGFVPWIVYWVLVGNVDVRLACVIPLGIAAVQTIRTTRAGASPKVLEMGTLVVFAALTVVAVLGDDAFLDRWIQPLSNGALFLITLGSALIGKPFALQYAREEVPAEVQDSPRFVRTTQIITWAWIGAFAVMTISSLVPPIVDGTKTMSDESDAVSVAFYWVIPFVVLAGALLFTKWYPDHVRGQSMARSGS